jgi:hypothetical protein
MPATNAGVAIHWIGPGAWRAQGNGNPGALMRQIRSWHTPQGKCDFAYSLAVNDSTVIEGRSTPARPRVRPASNGNASVNQSHYSVVLLIGDRDGPVPDAMLATAGRAVRWLRANAGAGPAVVGHRALTATACPGNNINSQLGRIAQLAAPPRPPNTQESDMVIFMQAAGTRYVAYPFAGVYRRIASPQQEANIRHVVARAGGTVHEWSPGADVDDLGAFGVLIT